MTDRGESAALLLAYNVWGFAAVVELELPMLQPTIKIIRILQLKFLPNATIAQNRVLYGIKLLRCFKAFVLNKPFAYHEE